MASLGWLMFGVHRAAGGRWLTGAAIFGLAAGFVGLIKPYVLFPFVLAGGQYIYGIRAPAGHAPVRGKHFALAIIGVTLAVVGVTLLGTLFPRYAVDTLGDQTRQAQLGASLEEGNSNYSLGDVPDSPTQQLAVAPLAFLTALFRPLPFEATGATSFICSLETVTLLLLAGAAFLRRSPRATWALVRGTPLLTFSLLYTLLFGTAVGLTTLNFGTLSRYRVPLMPFYVALILALNERRAVATEADAPEASLEGAHSIPKPRYRRHKRA